MKGSIQLYTSVPILTELAVKLPGKFRWEEERVKAVVRHVVTVATLLKPDKRLVVLADEPDNRILECAIEAGADAIVIGDRHLLDLRTYGGIEIVTLAVFLERNP